MARHEFEPYSFPDPEACFYFAALDFTFAVFLFLKSVKVGLAMTLIAALFAVTGILKRRRILR